ncbi:hypothetical protein M404DRAFT_966828 [Pisolithus tinctorius Marx 270]|uniref:Uncharacterized protein n=1 Tax=Pisolithus tinctorius Marx 270 TaxID=870435 RepID=A0A0C3PPX9_PISTI|nr:hypothetical protein M404DRAFT_966828 [Pisolithus tinctorius Marx 270]
MATLLQTIQCLSEATDFIGVIGGFKAWGLFHVDYFVIGKCAIQVCAFDIDLMEFQV